MKHLLLTTIAAVLLVGCGPSEADRALFKAAERGNIKAVKQQLAAGADVNAKDDKLIYKEMTPLHFAVGKGHKEIVELLIAKGADVNAKSEDEVTPLHFATTKEIAELLIAEGADVNAKRSESDWFKGQTPLDLAIQVKNTEVADLHRKHGGKTVEELKAEGK
jgi:cytohesin